MPRYLIKYFPQKINVVGFGIAMMTRHKRDLVCLAALRAGDPGIRDDKQASDYTRAPSSVRLSFYK